MIAQHGTLEISRARLAHNVALLRSRIGKARLCAAIKADAYGHGVNLLAELLQEQKVEWACVYSLPEALSLARFHPFNLLVLAPLVLREPNPGLIRHILDHTEAAIRLNVTDIRTAESLAKSLAEVGGSHVWPVHVQVDAGLTRNGIAPGELAGLVERIGELPNLKLEGVFAHFSHGDVPGHATVEAQLAALREAAGPVKARRPEVVLHLQNSGGALHLGDSGLDMVRIGIALYGLQPSTDDPIAGLQPIARVVAPVIVVHDVPANRGVGYGHTYVTRRASRLAVVPVGYADGYPRQLSGKGVVQVRGQDVPVVGRVSMDQIILDVTEHAAAGAIAPGEAVTVVSHEPGRPNCLDGMAEAIGTIGYELATHMGSRLRRVVVD